MKKGLLLFLLCISAAAFAQNILYKDCVNYHSRPEKLTGARVMTVFNEDIKTLEDVADNYRLIIENGKGWIITPYGDALKSLQLYYLNEDSVVLDKETFQIEEVAVPDFVARKDNDSLLEGKIAAGDVFCLEAVSKNSLTLLDGRFQCRFATITLYKEKGDTTKVNSIRLEVSGFGNKLYFYTKNIPEIESYRYGKIRLEEIFRKNFRNKSIPYEGATFEYEFSISPHASASSLAKSADIARFSPALITFETPDKFVPAQKRPEAINLDEVRREIGYPTLAREAGLEGDFYLRLLVSPLGEVQDYVVTKEIHPVLAEQVTKVIHKLRFTPAILSDRAIYFWVMVPFKFRLQ